MSQMEVSPTYPAKYFSIVDSNKRWLIAHGGRGSAKSRSIAQQFVVRTLLDGKPRICTRPVQKSIRDSSHKLIKWAINHLGLDEYFEININYIRLKRNGAEFIFNGMRDLKSTEGVQDAWIDEAQDATDEMVQELEPTIREKGSQIFASYNPKNDDDAINVIATHEAYEDDRTVVVMNWRDNPWFPEELNKSRLTMKRFNLDLYNHIWEGGILKQIAGAIIKPEWFHYYDKLPTSILRAAIIGDTAVKTKEYNDYTVFLFAGLGSDNNIYLMDLYRDKVESVERETHAVSFWNKHKKRHLYGIGADSFKIEDASSGSDLIQRLSRSGKVAVQAITRTSSDNTFNGKFGRLMDVISVISGEDGKPGRIMLPSSPIIYSGQQVTDASWVADFVDECQQFSHDEKAYANDDQVDTLIDAINELGSNSNWAAMVTG